MTSTVHRSLLVTAGVVAVLFGLVATFPARLALAWFAPPQLRAWGVEGTVWQGRAAEFVLGDRSLGALSWNARPARLLMLDPTWDLELRQQDGYARARVSFSPTGRRQTLTDLDASMELSTLPPAVVPIGVAGQARLSLQRLVIERGWPLEISGRATVSELELPGVILALGPFEFLFPERSDRPLAEIRSQGGPLEVDGRVELPARGQWHFRADLAPGENPPRELVEGLAFVGEDLGDGRRRLILSSEP
jgi:general secretion pathway protein N